MSSKYLCVAIFAAHRGQSRCRRGGPGRAAPDTRAIRLPIRSRGNTDRHHWLLCMWQVVPARTVMRLLVIYNCPSMPCH